ncbi:MFS transporter [Scytonema sp. UIC 10036]|uniref:MFS transporter n=1 Tax=Scytonema sp. UIC 10036 TaxID=2304196 RepID=UPI0012DA7CED|nr:MFS transporter [Scytonema sp. UIC 10036]MUG95999.1 MFS transporter [Scytonema sp. UIC 10036]
MKLQQDKSNLTYKDNNLNIIISVTLTSVMGVMAINPALPAIGEAFKVPNEQIGLVMASFLIPIAIGTPIFGVLADRIGRKKILIPSLLLFALGGILSAFARDFRSLLEWRFLQGVGAASLESLSLTVIADVYSGKMLTAAMAFNASMIGLSATVYPLVGGGLAQLSWQYPFFLSVFALPIALLVLTQLKLPKTQSQRSVDEFKLKAYLRSTWKSINNRSVLALLFAVLSLFILEFGSCFICIPLLAANNLGASGAVIGIILASMEITLALFASQLGWFAQKFSEVTLIKISFVVCAVSLLIAPLMSNVWQLFIPVLIFGAGLGIALPSIQTVFARLAPEDNRAGFMAMNVTLQSLGRALGPALVGIAFGFVGIQGALYASAIFALVTFIVLNSFLVRTTQKPEFVGKSEHYIG